MESESIDRLIFESYSPKFPREGKLLFTESVSMRKKGIMILRMRIISKFKWKDISTCAQLPVSKCRTLFHGAWSALGINKFYAPIFDKFSKEKTQEELEYLAFVNFINYVILQTANCKLQTKNHVT